MQYLTHNHHKQQPMPPLTAVLALLLIFHSIFTAGLNAQVPSPRGAQNQQETPEVDYDSLPTEDEETVLILPNIDTNAMLDILEFYTGKPIIRQASVPQVQFNFDSKGPLSKADAMLAVESLLALNGITITEIGDKFLKAVPAGTAVNQVPPLIMGSTLDLDPSLKIYGKVFKLYFLTVEEATALIQPLSTNTVANGIMQLQKANSVLVTDSLLNLQRIEETLEILDQPMETGLETLFFQLDFIEASELQKRLENLQSGSLKNRLEFNTTFDADDRTNQLLVFTHPANAKMITDLVDKLDIDVAPLTKTEMYALKHADAEEVTGLIEQLITGQQRAREQQEGSANRNNRTNTTANVQASAGAGTANVQRTIASASAGGGENKSLQFSDFLTIVADTRSNAILATGTPADHLYLEKLIGDIDVLLAQVRIEVVVAEVELTNRINRGLQAFGFSYNEAGNGELVFNPSIGGLSFGDNGITVDGDGGRLALKDVTISMIIEAARVNNNATILSAPTIMTTHNQPGTITVGSQRPVVSSTSSGTTGDSFRSNVQLRDATLELEVTPLIGSNGVVQMEIKQKVDSFGADVEIVGAGTQPTINTNQASSFVSVKDGEMIILGGLQQVDYSKNSTRLKGLGLLPIVGGLFGDRSQDATKKELILFIKPHVIKTTDDAVQDVKDYMNTLDDPYQVNSYLENGQFDWERAIEKPRERNKRLNSELKEAKQTQEAADWIDTGFRPTPAPQPSEQPEYSPSVNANNEPQPLPEQTKPFQHLPIAKTEPIPPVEQHQPNSEQQQPTREQQQPNSEQD